MKAAISDAAPEAALIYPVEAEPGTGDGSAIEIAEGVRWLRMPLAPALPWINVWALDDRGGLSIIDTGIHSDETEKAWTSAFGGALRDLPVVRIIATHMHPDHCGMAGWLSTRFGAELWMSRSEYLTCRLMAADSGRAAPQTAIDFYRSAGWSAAALERYQSRFGEFGKLIYPMPASYHRVSAGDVLHIGKHEWQVVVGHGHSPEHMCLYCPTLKLFISGDQVLPRISSNVSVLPLEPNANPLEDWLTSLKHIAATVPDDVLVLPAHKSPFRGLHCRIAQLIEGHESALKRLEASLAGGVRCVDMFGTLFFRPITPELLSMATGECLAHLNYLVASGCARREMDDVKVWRWYAI